MTTALVGKVLVGRDVAVGGSVTTVRDVPDGAIAIFDKNFALLAAGATIDDSDVIYIVQGRTDKNGPVISAGIKGTDVRVWTGATYAAGTKKSWEVGYSRVASAGSIPIQNNALYEIIVSLTSDDDRPQNRHRFSVNTNTSGNTRALILKQLAYKFVTYTPTSTYGEPINLGVTLIGDGVAVTTVVYNGYSFAQVGFSDASVDANTGLLITGTDDIITFGLGVDITLIDGTEDVSTTVTEGVFAESVGTPAKTLLLEKNYSGYRGAGNQIDAYDLMTLFTNPSVNYNIYCVQWTTYKDSGMSGGDNTKILHVAVPNGASTWDKVDFEATLNNWMQSANSGLTPVIL